MTAYIQLDNVSFCYPGAQNPALDGISLEIAQGTFTGIAGASNAGKSTLCAALCGIVPRMYRTCAQGQLTMAGNPVFDMDSGQLSGIVGMVLQIPRHQLSGVRYTVFEEAAFGLENLGMKRETIIARVKKALAQTSLSEFARRSPFDLSGGQQQRLAIACALAADPQVLVLDEPTTFLDPMGVKQVFELLSRLHKKGKTIVIAEQRLEWIAEYADRVIVLKQGRKVMDGPPETVLAAPELKHTGLARTRYSQVAALAREKGIWPQNRSLSASFEATLKGLKQP